MTDLTTLFRFSTLLPYDGDMITLEMVSAASDGQLPWVATATNKRRSTRDVEYSTLEPGTEALEQVGLATTGVYLSRHMALVYKLKYFIGPFGVINSPPSNAGRSFCGILVRAQNMYF